MPVRLALCRGVADDVSVRFFQPISAALQSFSVKVWNYNSLLSVASFGMERVATTLIPVPQIFSVMTVPISTGADTAKVCN